MSRLPALAVVLSLSAGCTHPGWSERAPSGSADVTDTAGAAAVGPGEEAPSHSATVSPARPPRRGSNEVAVQLEAHEGAHELVADVDGRPRTLRPGPDGVVADDGERGPWLVLEGERLELGGRTYVGRLLIGRSPGGGLTVENQLDAEDYVRGVVAAELVIWSAPPALLEAQAIAARSYAWSQLLGRPGKPARERLSDTTRDQAYAGEYVPGDGAVAREVDERLRAAIDKTRGIVLSLDERVLDLRFHASCGGVTAAFEGVFDEPDPGGMQPVSCAPCTRIASSSDSTGVRWSWTADAAALDGLAADLDLGSRLQAIVPARNNGHGRWIDVQVAGDRRGTTTSATELRRLLGWNHLKSAWVTRTMPASARPVRTGADASVSTGGGAVVFEGLGRGHGVGLCQTGARVYAEEGHSAASILLHYFPTAALSRISGN